MYQSYDMIPELWQSVIQTVSGETDIRRIPLEDINGFIEMMEGSDI